MLRKWLGKRRIGAWLAAALMVASALLGVAPFLMAYGSQSGHAGSSPTAPLQPAGPGCYPTLISAGATQVANAALSVTVGGSTGDYVVASVYAFNQSHVFYTPTVADSDHSTITQLATFNYLPAASRPGNFTIFSFVMAGSGPDTVTAATLHENALVLWSMAVLVFPAASTVSQINLTAETPTADSISVVAPACSALLVMSNAWDNFNPSTGYAATPGWGTLFQGSNNEADQAMFLMNNTTLGGTVAASPIDVFAGPAGSTILGELSVTATPVPCTQSESSGNVAGGGGTVSTPVTAVAGNTILVWTVLAGASTNTNGYDAYVSEGGNAPTASGWYGTLSFTQIPDAANGNYTSYYVPEAIWIATAPVNTTYAVTTSISGQSLAVIATALCTTNTAVDSVSNPPGSITSAVPGAWSSTSGDPWNEFLTSTTDYFVGFVFVYGTGCSGNSGSSTLPMVTFQTGADHCGQPTYGAQITSLAAGDYNGAATWFTTGDDFSADGVALAATGIPSPPTDLNAMAVSTSQVVTTWDNPSAYPSLTDNHDLIFAGSSCSSFLYDQDIGSVVTTYEWNGLVASTTYSFEVTASNSMGQSSVSACATATTEAPPNPASCAAQSISIATAANWLALCAPIDWQNFTLPHFPTASATQEVNIVVDGVPNLDNPVVTDRGPNGQMTAFYIVWTGGASWLASYDLQTSTYTLLHQWAILNFQTAPDMLHAYVSPYGTVPYVFTVGTDNSSIVHVEEYWLTNGTYVDRTTAISGGVNANGGGYAANGYAWFYNTDTGSGTAYIIDPWDGQVWSRSLPNSPDENSIVFIPTTQTVVNEASLGNNTVYMEPWTFNVTTDTFAYKPVWSPAYSGSLSAGVENDMPWFFKVFPNGTVETWGENADSGSSSTTFHTFVLWTFANVARDHETALLQDGKSGTGDQATVALWDSSGYSLNGYDHEGSTPQYQSPFNNPLNQSDIYASNSAWFNSFMTTTAWGWGSDASSPYWDDAWDFEAVSGWEFMTQTGAKTMLYWLPTYNSTEFSAYDITPVTETGTSVSLAWGPLPNGTTAENISYGTSENILNHNLAIGPYTSDGVYGLSPNTTYYFEVTAWDGTTELNITDEVSVMTVGPATAPTGLMATAITTTRIDLTFNNPVGESLTQDVFYIWLGPGCTNLWSSGNTVSPAGGPNTVSVTSLQPATRYYFNVTAYNSTGPSPPSNCANARTLTPTPPSLTVSAITATTFTEAWTVGGWLNITVAYLDFVTSCGIGARQVGVWTYASGIVGSPAEITSGQVVSSFYNISLALNETFTVGHTIYVSLYVETPSHASYTFSCTAVTFTGSVPPPPGPPGASCGPVCIGALITVAGVTSLLLSYYFILGGKRGREPQRARIPRRSQGRSRGS